MTSSHDSKGSAPMTPDAHAVMLERQRVERTLFEERERLRITLASIGDAVISTDAAGRIVYLNGVAETLTGWKQDEAIGLALPEVFRIINEVTRQPVDNPAMRALVEGRIVELANHTLLIAKDGAEVPIDDSAAPMRDAAGATIGAVLVFRDVTERRRAQEAQARLAAIVENSDDAIVSKTLDGVIRSWNLGAQRIFGYTSEEVVGRHISVLIPPELLEEENEILRRLRSGERIDHFETVRVAKDGRRVDISITVSPVKNREGQIIGASKVGRDVTDRKRAERILRESERRQRFLAELGAATQPLDNADAMMATTARLLAEHLNVDRCAYAEIEEQRVFVITGDYARGVNSIVGRWPVSAFGAECERLMLANEPFVIEDVNADPRAGSDLSAYRAASIQALICVPLHKGGRFVAALAVYQKVARHWSPADIDMVRTVANRSWESLERTRVARGLREAAERLTLAFNAALLGDWSWDAKTDIVHLSPRAGEIFGVEAGPVMTWTKMQEMLHEEDRVQARIAVERSVATREQYDIEYRVRRPTGDVVWVSAKGHANYDANGTALGMLGLVQDVTEKKKLEQELRQRAEELAEADRKKDDFIALLAHELRNPLAPVRTGLQVMRLSPNDAVTVEKTRAVMERQISHMARLIDDLLDVSRLNRNKLNLQKAPVALADVINHAVEVVRPALDAAEHELTVSLPEEPVMLDADLTRLAQVFGNLLTNSAKYTARRGQISVSAELSGDQVAVAVRDNGIGIPAESLAGVFDMFSQVDRSVEKATGGLGIGLALVKGLVESHGGTVTVQSEGAGKGSCFVVCLPVMTAAQASANKVALQEKIVRGDWTVVVADDNEDGADTMAFLLKALGCTVHVAHDGVAAVDLVEKVRPDLVLMDVGMPELDGLEATQRIRSQPWGRDVTILALTGWGQESDRQRSREAGCDGHLVKPVDLPEIQEALKHLKTGVRRD